MGKEMSSGVSGASQNFRYPRSERQTSNAKLAGLRKDVTCRVDGVPRCCKLKESSLPRVMSNFEEDKYQVAKAI